MIAFTHSLMAMDDFTSQPQQAITLKRLSFLESLLLYAAKNNKTYLVKACMSLGVDPDVTDMHKAAAFHYGVSNYNLEMLHCLAAHGAQVNRVTVGGCSALHITAMLHNKSKLARWLLDHGALIDSQDEEGFTPMHRAVQFHHEKVARVLVERGCNVGIRNRAGVLPEETDAKCLFDICYAPFSMALSAGELPGIQKYLQQGVNLGFKTSCGTPMHWALLSPDFNTILPVLCEHAASKHEVLVAQNQALSEVSIDSVITDLVNLEDLQQETPLHWAGQMSCLSKWQALLRCGAQLTHLDDHDTTPLYKLNEVLQGWEMDEKLRKEFFAFIASPLGTLRECKLVCRKQNADAIFAFLCVLRRYETEHLIKVPQDIRHKLVALILPEGIHDVPYGSFIKRKRPLRAMLDTTSFSQLAYLIEQGTIDKDEVHAELIARHDAELVKVCALEFNQANVLLGMKLDRAFSSEEYQKLRDENYRKLLEFVKEPKE